MPPKETGGVTRRSARQSGKAPDAADDGVLVDRQTKDPAPAEKGDISLGDIHTSWEPIGNWESKIS